MLHRIDAVVSVLSNCLHRRFLHVAAQVEIESNESSFQDIIFSSAETMGAFHMGFDTVDLQTYCTSFRR